MRKLLALLALTASGPALAQSFPKPTDVEAYDNSNETRAWATGTTLNVLGDGSNTSGGTPEVYGDQLADIPSTASGEIEIGSTGGDFTPSTPGGEAKFRGHVDTTHLLYDDPIRNFGAPGTSHCHVFAGNATANAYSTYGTLRNKAIRSKSVGRSRNGTAYWSPCVLDGTGHARKPDLVVIYYLQDEEDAPELISIPRGFRYVFGFNMDDPLGTTEQAARNARNAATPGRYTDLTPANSTAIQGWKCFTDNGNTFVAPTAGGIYSQHLKNADNSDPWGGNCSGATAQLFHDLDAPECIDTKNLWSPGGYKHIRPMVNDNVAGKPVCATGEQKVPGLIITWIYNASGGFADYGNWRLSSDTQVQTATGTTILNGSTMHTDWMDGWDYTARSTWEGNCPGVYTLTPHLCATGTISATQRLKYDWVDLTMVPITDKFKLPTAGTGRGPATIQHGGN